MALQLYTYPDNPRAFKALITALYNDVEIEVPPFSFGTTNKTPEFLRMNPLGKVPVLSTPEGAIFESNAIARYVARLGNQSMYGSSLYQTGVIDQWLDFASNEIEPAAVTWLGPILGFLTYQRPAAEKAKETIFRALEALNSVLSDRTFLVDNHITLADVVVFCTVMGLYKFVLDRPLRAKFPHVSRWFATVLAQPNVSGVVGAFEFCEQAAEPVPAKKAEGGNKSKAEGGKAKGDAKPKAEGGKKNKKQEEPEEAAAPAAPAPAAHAEEEEEESFEDAPKGKNPLDFLPKSNFNLEEWKRQYSNTDTRNGAIPWLWSNFDAEGFSFHFADYKYNNELSVPFMASNLVQGFHQRADGCRKYAFSSMLITGEAGNLVIRGVWLFRGPEVPDVMKAVDDCELYDWRKADLSNNSDKALIEDMLAWDKPIDGRPVLDGKSFK